MWKMITDLAVLKEKLKYIKNSLVACVCQGWGRFQRHDYDYTMITKNDYDYSQRTLITKLRLWLWLQYSKLWSLWSVNRNILKLEKSLVITTAACEIMNSPQNIPWLQPITEHDYDLIKFRESVTTIMIMIMQKNVINYNYSRNQPQSCCMYNICV